MPRLQTWQSILRHRLLQDELLLRTSVKVNLNLDGHGRAHAGFCFILRLGGKNSVCLRQSVAELVGLFFLFAEHLY